MYSILGLLHKFLKDKVFILLQKSMHALALGYYKRDHRVRVICFTLGSEGLFSFADSV